MSEKERIEEEETVPYGFKRITPSEKRRLVNEHFIAIAQRYDLSDTLLSFGLHHLWKRKAVKLTGLKEGDADNGFTDLSYKRLTNGIAIIYICKKK